MFDKLLKAAIGTVLLPVDVVADIVTMGGVMNDQDKPHTVKRLEQIGKNVDKALK